MDEYARWLLSMANQAFNPLSRDERGRPWSRRGVPGLVRGMVEDVQRHPVRAAVDMTPVVGDAKAVGYDAPMAFSRGETGIGLLALASALPVIPNLARGVKSLPMDEASRMARASEMGFDVDVPVYHGTNADFNSFGSPLNWGAKDPSLATQYAVARANIEERALGKPYAPRVLPVMVRTERPLAFPMDLNAKTTYRAVREATGVDVRPGKYGSEAVDGIEQRYAAHEIVNTPEFAEALRAAGYDAVRATEGGYGTVGVVDPKNIRSRWAAFDPSQSESANLLAGAAGLLGTGALLRQRQRERRPSIGFSAGVF